ncbi:hypothetical protein BC835DRAFT_309608 [Cytidiella melzeri]|nr:hypothetical protein BC835DRAFT_309608 [Cytidiella melzeri]
MCRQTGGPPKTTSEDCAIIIALFEGPNICRTQLKQVQPWFKPNRIRTSNQIESYLDVSHYARPLLQSKSSMLRASRPKEHEIISASLEPLDYHSSNRRTHREENGMMKLPHFEWVFAVHSMGSSRRGPTCRREQNQYGFFVCVRPGLVQ